MNGIRGERRRTAEIFKYGGFSAQSLINKPVVLKTLRRELRRIRQRAKASG
jgi:hypothetical protein